MANASIEIEIRALDNASRALDNIERSLGPINRKVGRLDDEFDRVDSSINRASGSFGRFRGLLAGAITVGGITAFTNSVIEASSRAEDLKTTLETVTGSAEAGNEAFQFINDFATRTPFDIETLTETFIKLQAAGIEPTEELLTTFGDMASVTTDRVGSLQAITDLFARTTAGGLGLEDLNRLADRGIPVFDILNEKLGVTRLEVSELGQSMEGAEQIRQALLEGLNEDFGGGMEKASENLSVSLSNLGIAANNALIAVGEGGLSDAINSAAQRMSAFIADNEDLALAIGEKLGQAVTLVVDGFGVFMEKMEQAKPIFDLIGTVLSELVVPAFGFLFDTLVTVADAVAPLAEEYIPILKDAFVEIADIIATVVTAAFEGIKVTIQGVMDFIHGAVETARQAWEFVSGIADSVGGAARAVGDKASQMGGAVLDTASDLGRGAIETGRDWYNGVTGWFSDTEEEVVGNSIVPDMVNSVGNWMDMLVGKMVDPTREASDSTTAILQNMMNTVSTGLTPQAAIASPVSGVGATAGPVSSNVNFHSCGVNLNNNEVTAEMKKYVEGVAIQVANKVLRQQTNFGGLI